MKKQIITKEIKHMQKLAGILNEVLKMNRYLIKKYLAVLEEYLDILSKQVVRPDLFKNNFQIWESALFYDYNEALKNQFIKTSDISEEEFNKLHNELNSESNYPFNYFVRNWFVTDGEQARHEEDENQDLNYFKTTYNVDDKTASIMKNIIDMFLGGTDRLAIPLVL
jgi:hypothetical protein